MSSLIVPATATRLTASVSDQEILGVAHNWAHALAAQDYERAYGMTAHDPYYAWSGSLIRRYLHLVAATGLLAAFILWPLSALVAQERVLRFPHMLPEKSAQHQDIFPPWARKIAQASNGRLRLNVTAAMQLGGKPAELITQVEGHQVDIVWTLPGYTPGKFPRLEVCELPWIASSRASATSQALYEYYETYARQDLANVHVLAVWCH